MTHLSRAAAQPQQPDDEPADVLGLLLALAAVASPSGREGDVAKLVRAHFDRLGVTVHVDGAGETVGSDTGNLVVRIPGTTTTRAPVFLCAHLDTVPSAELQPVVAEGVVVNAAEGVLGIDNKAAVAVFMHVAEVLIRRRAPSRDVYAVFTIAEETGHWGAKALDLSVMKARMGLVYDLDGPIGRIAGRAPAKSLFTWDFAGRAAHSGLAAGDGRSAIVAAANAVAGLGRLPTGDRATVNVGRISGGSAHNIVAADCRVTGEIRSLDENQHRDLRGALQAVADDAAACAGCCAVTSVEDLYPAYALDRDSMLVRAAIGGLEACGFAPDLIDTTGGSDASSLIARGLECVNLANGMLSPHEPDERVAVQDLHDMARVTFAILDALDALEDL